MSARASGSDTTVDGGQRGGAKTDRFYICVRMMNTHATGWRHAGTVPTGVENVKARVRQALQLNQRKINVVFGSPENCSALVLRHRPGAMRAAGRRLEIPIHNHRRGVT